MDKNETFEEMRAREDQERETSPILFQIRELRQFAIQSRQTAERYDHMATLMQRQYDTLTGDKYSG